MRVLLVSANRERMPSPVVPIGILSVAASLRDAHEVSVLDVCFESDPAAALRERIAQFSPEIVGIGIRNLHTNAYDGTEQLITEYAALVAAVRECSAARVVLGGSGYSLQPNALLDRIGGDHGVVGEGERAFRDLVDALARGEEVARLVHGAAVSTVTLRTSKIKSDLDLLPRPARDLVDPRYALYDGTANLQSKRGCAFQCSYCDYPDLEGRKVRVRDPEAVAAELEGLARTPGVTHAFFVDSVFNVPPLHALAICDAISARHAAGAPKIPWVCYVSPVALDDRLVAAMARAGCVGAEIGTDTGSSAMLKRLKKPFTLADVEESRALFLRHDLLDCHTFVLGAEGETAEEAAETLRFVDRLAPDVAVFIVFMEDRESRTPHRSEHRDALLALLASEAPKRPGWVVPELGIRFGAKVTRMVERAGLRGPSWLHLARNRRPPKHPMLAALTG